MTVLAVACDVSLADLASLANAEIALAEEAANSELAHHIACGDALLKAKAVLAADGEWGLWLEENFDASYVTASVCMRLAEHREVVQDQPSVKKALLRLKEVGAVRKRGVTGYGEQMRDEARRLRSTGMAYAEIADVLCASKTAVRTWVDPDIARREAVRKARLREERRAAKQAALQRKAERAARQRGGAEAKVYSLMHQAEAPFAEILKAAETLEKKRIAEEAVELHHKLTDCVVRLVGVS